MPRSNFRLGFGCRPEAVCQEIKRQLRDGTFPPGAKLPTTEELAKYFQVSKNTVSRAMRLLSETGLIERRRGAGTFAAAPNANAAAPEARSVGICLPMLTKEGEALDPAESPTWFRIFGGVAAELDELGYTLSIIPRTGTPLAEQVRRRRPAGLLLPGKMNYLEEILTGGICHQIPCLFMDNPGFLSNINYRDELGEVCVGEIFAALKERGFRRFGLFSSAETDFIRTAVWRGFRRAVTAADGYSIHYEQPIPEGAPQSEYDLALTRLLALPEPPEILVVVRERFLGGVLKALAKRSLKVPEDISLFLIENDGERYDNISGARLADKAEQGRLAARAIVALVEQKAAGIRENGPWRWHDGTTLKFPEEPARQKR